MFAGFALWNEQADTVGGMHFSGALRLGRHAGLVGDLAFYEEDFRSRTVMGGVRVYSTPDRVTLFGQVLVGNSLFSDVAFQPGVGADVQLRTNVAIRAEFDVKGTGDDGAVYVGTRFSIGVVMQFGRK